MLYNTQFITNRVILGVTVEAQDRDDAHTRGLDTIQQELGLNLIPIRYQIEVEELDQ